MININNEQKLYVIPCKNGYTMLDFEYAYNKALAICLELNIAPPSKNNIGSERGYSDYLDAVNTAKNSGKYLSCELTKQFIGLEGKRVEVVTTYDEKRRFIIGKSTGFIPCHLEIKTIRSAGGIPAETEYKSVRVI